MEQLYNNELVYRLFLLVVFFLTMASCVLLFIQAEFNVSDGEPWLIAVEIVILVLFMVEILLRVAAYSIPDFFGDKWNV